MTEARGELLIATGSRHKFDELSQLLDLPRTYLLSLTDVGLTDSAEEHGQTFEENAVTKALHYARLSGIPTLADDSGLEVDALGGRPGVLTARYAGPDATDEQNNTLMLAELGQLSVAPEKRTARYRCVLVLAEPSAEPSADDEPVVAATTHGAMEGRIALQARGDGGFGYDPIFEPASEPVGARTVGQLMAAEKNEISHRAQAARAMRELLIARGY